MTKTRPNGFQHELPNNGLTNDWITPPYVLDWFNDLTEEPLWFDLDPCISLYQFYKTANNSFNIQDDGLNKEWHGNVWCNPPYGKHTKHWIKKLVEHKNGVALIFARTETKLWQDYIFPTADAVLFINRRIKFLRANKKPGEWATTPSALVAWGLHNERALAAIANSIYKNKKAGWVLYPYG